MSSDSIEASSSLESPVRVGASVRGKRIPVTRTRRLTLKHLGAEDRSQLIDQLFQIVCEFFEGMDRPRFEKTCLPTPDTRVALFYGPNGELAGFSSAVLTEVKAETNSCHVFSAGVFVRLAYQGGRASALFGLTEALRFKLRHPLSQLAYLAVATSPAPYLLYARTMPRIYPFPGRETPDEVSHWALLAARQRGLAPSGANPWIVKAPARLKGASSSSAFSSVKEDPYAKYFFDANPGFREGNGLLVWVPLDFRNLLGALLRSLTRGWL